MDRGRARFRLLVLGFERSVERSEVVHAFLVLAFGVFVDLLWIAAGGAGVERGGGVGRRGRGDGGVGR